MIISIEPSLIKQFPHVKIGILIGNDVNNTIESADIITHMRQAEQKVKNTLSQDITQIPKINDWREAYRAFGCKPSEYRSSIEALVRRIIKGNELPTINPIVDIYNIVSISYLLPAGGGDLDCIEGNIRLTKAKGGEKFVMLGSAEPITIPAGEVVYSDDRDIVCRAWNYRESDKTKITTKTKNVYLMLEGLEHVSKDEIEHALLELKKLLSTFCGGKFKTHFLDSENQTVTT